MTALRSSSGYTVVEVMIFLAVTGGLFVLIAATFNGQQGRTTFSTAARDMESRMQDILNDISTGYYNHSGNFTCTATSVGPQIVPGGSAGQGQNQDCIFIGRVAHFAINGVTNQFYVYTVAGLRQTQGGVRRDVQNFGDAMPKAISSLSPLVAVDTTQKTELPGGMTLGRMYYQASGSPIVTDVAAVGFFSGFGSYTSGALQPGALNVSTIPFGTGATNEAGVVGLINGLATSNPTGPGTSPNGKFTICFASTTSSQHANLTIGGDNRQLSTDMEIGDGPC